MRSDDVCLCVCWSDTVETARRCLLGTITSAVDAATLRIRFAGTCVDDLFENFYSRAELKSCKGALPPVAVRFNADRVVVAPVLQLEDKLNGGALRKGTVVVGGVYIEAMGDGGVIVARQPCMGFLFLIRQFVNFFFFCSDGARRRRHKRRRCNDRRRRWWR